MSRSTRAFRRGLILPPGFGQRGNTLTIDGPDYMPFARFAAFYFDLACFPATMIPPTNMEGVDRHFDPRFFSTIFSPNYRVVDAGVVPDGRMLRSAVVEDVLNSHPASQKGRWSIIDSVDQFPQQGDVNRLFVELLGHFPVPRDDMSIHEILRFNGRNRQALIEFRNSLGEMAASLSGKEDEPILRDIIEDKIVRQVDNIARVSRMNFPTDILEKIQINFSLPSVVISGILEMVGFPSSAAILVGNSIGLGFSHSPINSDFLSSDSEYLISAVKRKIIA